MILKLIVDLFFGLVTLVVDLLPSIKISADISGAFGTVANFFGYLDSFVSLSAVSICIGLVILVDNASLLMKILNFIIRKIPGVD